MTSIWDKMNMGAVKKARQISRRTAATNAAKRGGGGKGGFWSDEIRIRGPYVNERGDLVEADTHLLRLLPGEYLVPPSVVEWSGGEYSGNLPYFVQIEYYHPSRGKRGCQVPDTRDWCDGKDLSRHLMEEEGDDTINERLMHYHSALDLSNWHRVQESRTIQDKKTGGDRTIQVDKWEKCQGRSCEHCDSGSERVYGRPVYVVFSPAIQESLYVIDQTVSRFCVCGHPTPLKVFQAVCTSCGHIYEQASFNEDTGDIEEPLHPSTLGKIYDQYTYCPGCNCLLDETEESVEAEKTAQVGEDLVCDGCANPERANIYYADLALTKEGLGPKVRLALDQGRFDARGFRVRKELDEKLMERARLFDFNKGLKRDLASVAKALGIPDARNPFANVQGYAPRKHPKTR